MTLSSIHSSNRKIRSVTYLGIFLNVVLGILKIVFGLIGHSMSLLADGIHSFSDTLTDFAVLLGVYLGAKEPDFSHPYGHGRMETFSAGGIAAVLVIVGLGMVYKAGKNLTDISHMPTRMVIIVAIISILGKEFLYRISKKVAVTSHSSALYANAWHHRTDSLSSIAVVAGVISIKFGFAYGDRVAAIAVGIMIALAGARILSGCLQELSESSIDKRTLDQIRNILNKKPDVRSWHKLRTRKAGREIFTDVHILVNPNLDVLNAHQISEDLENSIRDAIERPVNIIVHIEPDIPRQRKENGF